MGSWQPLLHATNECPLFPRAALQDAPETLFPPHPLPFSTASLIWPIGSVSRCMQPSVPFSPARPCSVCQRHSLPLPFPLFRLLFPVLHSEDCQRKGPSLPCECFRGERKRPARVIGTRVFLSMECLREGGGREKGPARITGARFPPSVPVILGREERVSEDCRCKGSLSMRVS